MLDKTRMKRACEIARNSIHPNCKVAAVIYANYTDENNCEVCYAWNKTKEQIQYPDSRQDDEHAETIMLRGIEFFLVSTEPTVYVTKAPCLNCAEAIVRKRIVRVVCPPPYRINPNTGKPSKWYDSQMQGLNLLADNGVDVDFMDVRYTLCGRPYLQEEDQKNGTN